MAVTGRRAGSLRLRALEAEAMVDGAAPKSTKSLAAYFGAPREPQVKAKPGSRAVIGERV